MSLAELVAEHEITRLCHLTPFSNLVHLASDEVLYSLDQLQELEGFYDQQDLQRLDGHPDHISCSIEYPNAWYLRQRRVRATPEQRLFPTWVCLAIDPSLLTADGTLVCKRNAAALEGAFIQDISCQSLQTLYDSPIAGAGGQTFTRGLSHLTPCPTDDQAEVLIARQIPYSAITKIIVADESEARRVHTGLKQIGAQLPPAWAIAPTLFSASQLSGAIRSGNPPVETPWQPDAHAHVEITGE